MTRRLARGGGAASQELRTQPDIAGASPCRARARSSGSSRQGLGLVSLAFAAGYGITATSSTSWRPGRISTGVRRPGPATPLVAARSSELAPAVATALRASRRSPRRPWCSCTGLLARELGGSRRAQIARRRVLGVRVDRARSPATGSAPRRSTCSLDRDHLARRARRAHERRPSTGSPPGPCSGRARQQAAAGVPRGRSRGRRPLPATAPGCCAARTSGRRGDRARALVPLDRLAGEPDWPQLDVSREIAAGGSTSSEPWWAIVPFQLLLVSPPLRPSGSRASSHCSATGRFETSGSSPGPGPCSRSCSWRAPASRTTSPGCCRCSSPPAP